MFSIYAPILLQLHVEIILIQYLPINKLKMENALNSQTTNSQMLSNRSLQRINLISLKFLSALVVVSLVQSVMLTTPSLFNSNVTIMVIAKIHYKLLAQILQMLVILL